MTLDAGEVYSAVKRFGLVAIAKEVYSDGRFNSLNYTQYIHFPLHQCLSVLCLCRRLHSLCSCSEEQQFGHKLPAGTQELSQRGSMDCWMESSTRLSALTQLPELVKGASPESR